MTTRNIKRIQKEPQKWWFESMVDYLSRLYWLSFTKRWIACKILWIRTLKYQLRSNELLLTDLPFILPVHFLHPAGLSETFLTNDEPECCDVRREEQSNNPSKGTVEKSGGSCHRTSLTVSSATRLCNSRLKLCVLVLILLHTVLTASAAQNATALSFRGVNPLEERSTNEEWQRKDSVRRAAAGPPRKRNCCQMSQRLGAFTLHSLLAKPLG